MSIRPSTLPRRRSILLVALLGLLLSTVAVHAEEYAQTTCDFDPEWIINPSLAEEVAYSGRTETREPDSTFCDFYQFSWQNFLYLVSPVEGTQPAEGEPYKANLLDSKQYLPYTSDTNPCAGTSPKQTFFGTMPTGLEPRDWKSLDDPDIYQASSRAVIYDRNGNPAIYSTRFSPDLCDLKKILPHPYFPAGTTELKMAWRILDEDKGDDPSLYYTIETSEDALGAGQTKPLTLGLIGFHIAVVTDAHPEMIWITIEHNLNDPLCDDVEKKPLEPIASHGYSFTKASCLGPNPEESCKFNHPTTYERNQKAPLHGDPTEICQVNQYGQLPDSSNPSDNDNMANQDAIAQLYAGFLENSSEKDWAKVWTHYRMVGALWLSQPYKEVPRRSPGAFNSSDCDEDMEDCYTEGIPGKGTHQRGSLALANSVAETDFQGETGFQGSANDASLELRNCFGCHQFTTNTTDMVLSIERMKRPVYGSESLKRLSRGTGSISHIFGNIVDAQCQQAEMYYPNSSKNFDPDDVSQVIERCRQACSYTGEAFPLWTGKYYLPERLTERSRLQCECCSDATR